MTLSQKIWTCLAAGHLLFAGMYAFAVPVPFTSVNAVDKAVKWYGGVSGGNNSFGFFKQVGCGLQAIFTMTDEDGKQYTETLVGDTNQNGEEEDKGLLSQEITLRLHSNTNMVSTVGDVQMTQWAAEMFGRHPQAVAVSIEVQIYDPGTMEDYRNGYRPEWKTSTVKAFTRRDFVIRSAHEGS